MTPFTPAAPVEAALFWTKHLDAWLELVSTLACFVLTMVAGRRILQRRISLAFTIFTFDLFLWVATNFFQDRVPGHAMALFLTRFTMIFALLLPVLFYHFCLSYTARGFPRGGRRYGIILGAAYGVCAVAAGLIFLGSYYVRDAVYVTATGRWDAVPGPAFALQIIFVLLFVFLSTYRLLNYAWGIKSPVEKNRVKYIFLGMLALAVSGGFDSLKISGLRLLPDLMSFGIAVFCFTVFLGIYRRRLLDLDFALQRTAVGFLFLGVSFLIFEGVSRLCLAFFEQFHLYSQGITAEVLGLGAALVFFYRYMGRLGSAALSWLSPYRSRYEAAVRDFSSRALSGFSLAAVTVDFERVAGESLGVEKAGLILQSREMDIFRQAAGQVWILDDLQRRLFQEILTRPELDEVKRIMVWMQERSVELASPVYFGTELLAVIILGAKPRGIYDRRDALLFEDAGRQLGAAIKNILNQDAIRQQENLARMGEMAAGIAHEIKNPLGAIQGAAQYLESVMPADKDRRFAGIILAETRRLDRTVTDFLQFSRPLAWRPGRGRPDEILKNVIQLMEMEESFRGVTWHKELGANSLEIDLDGDLIKQVFLNLAVNACQAMEGSGKLQVFSAESRENGRSWYSARFVDGGPGVPPQLLTEIFKPFFTTKSKGSGLGLSLCEKIVRQHQGRIQVESRPGRTEFAVYLPGPQDYVPAPVIAGRNTK